MIVRPQLRNATTKADRELYDEIRECCYDVMSYARDLKLLDRMNFTCHSVALAFTIMFPQLKLGNGLLVGVKWMRKNGKVFHKFMMCEHSWLITKSGNIIDTYPVGYMTLEPIFVVTKGDYKYYGGTSYFQDENIQFMIKKSAIRRKAYELLRIMRKARKKID